jgi:hypothetical protein
MKRTYQFVRLRSSSFGFVRSSRSLKKKRENANNIPEAEKKNEINLSVCLFTSVRPGLLKKKENVNNIPEAKKRNEMNLPVRPFKILVVRLRPFVQVPKKKREGMLIKSPKVKKKRNEPSLLILRFACPVFLLSAFP